MDTTTGDLWRQARIARGWSREEAGRAVGISPEMLRSIEVGRRIPSAQTMRRVAGLLGVPMPQTGDGGGGRQKPSQRELTPDEYEAMLRACWSLFYAGRTQDAVDAVAGAVRSLGVRGVMVLPLLGRFQQLAGVLARDDKRLMDAITAGAAAVEIARQGASPDYLAAALFRLARTYQMADQHAVALHTMHEAHRLAPQCRQPLAGWLKLCRVEIEAKALVAPEARMPLIELRRMVEQAMTDAVNRPGQDDSYTTLSVSGVWHIEVQALLRDPGYTHEALDLVRQAVASLTPDQHRWRYGMMATEAMIYALQGDAEQSADLAEEVLGLTNANSHLRYLRRGLVVLERTDPERRNPHVVRLHRLLAEQAA